MAAGIGLGVASALIQLTMNWVQKSVSPARVTIIYAGELGWAGIIDRMADDRLRVWRWLAACSSSHVSSSAN